MRSDATLARTVLLVRLDVFLDLEEAAILNGLTAARVRIAADTATASSPAGQTALVAAVLGIAQGGAGVYLDIPDAALAGPQPPLRGARLLTGLMELADNFVQPASTDPERVDLAFVLGDASPGLADHVMYVEAGDWNCRLSERPISAGVPGMLPFGALLAAAAIGAESLRCALRLLGESFDVMPSAEHSLISAPEISLKIDPIAAGPLDLGDVDVISAGAITNSTLFALLRWPGVHGRLRVMDDDVAEEGNLNRYALLRRADVDLGRAKVDVLTHYATTDLVILPCKARFAPSTCSTLLPLANRVIVGVDDIPSRWLVAQHAPSWVCVAGTTHFAVIVSEHIDGGPCAGCLHPRDDPDHGEIPTASFVSHLAGFLQAHRLLTAASVAAPSAPTLAAPFNLGAPRALTEIGLSPRHDCPVRCAASCRVHNSADPAKPLPQYPAAATSC